MTVYFMIGSLPWQGLKIAKRAERYQRVLEMKQTISVEELCRGLPPVFATYLTYIHALKKSDKPDYRYLRNPFGQLFHKQNCQSAMCTTGRS